MAQGRGLGRILLAGTAAPAAWWNIPTRFCPKMCVRRQVQRSGRGKTGSVQGEEEEWIRACATTSAGIPAKKRVRAGQPLYCHVHHGNKLVVDVGEGRRLCRFAPWRCSKLCVLCLRSLFPGVPAAAKHRRVRQEPVFTVITNHGPHHLWAGLFLCRYGCGEEQTTR